MIIEYTLSESARNLAHRWHSEKMYGYVPFVNHLEDVVSYVIRFKSCIPDGIDLETMIAAAYLHDIMEDTECPEAAIIENSSLKVFELVSAVTTDPSKKIRKYRYDEAFFLKLRETEGAVFLKLCDRISNTFHCKQDPRFKSLLKAYLKENEIFVRVCSGLGYDLMFDELKALSN